MDDVVGEAKRLADLLAGHARTKALQEASAALSKDEAASRLEREYARATAEVHALEETGRPIEPDLKRRLADLQAQVRRSAPLQRLLRAHAEFGEMMDAVQRTIGGAVDQALGATDADEEGDAEAHEGEGERQERPREEEPPPAKGKGGILWTP